MSHHSLDADRHTAQPNHGDSNISVTKSILFFALFTTLVDSICFPFVCISCNILILSSDGILSIVIIQSITDWASEDNGVDHGIQGITHGVPGADHGVHDTPHCVIRLYNHGLSLRITAI